jgi:Flp pilus assembly pilin Flp
MAVCEAWTAPVGGHTHVAIRDDGMTRFAKKRAALGSDRAGVTALEYGILAGVLGLVLLAIFMGLGSTLTTEFVKIGGSV